MEDSIIVKVGKISKTYICPFCGYSRSHRNKTEIKYRGRWKRGCQGCFLSSVEDQALFNKKPLKIIQDEE